MHPAISASGHRVARQAGGSGGTLPVGRAPRLDPWDTASFKLGDDLRGHLVIEIDAGRGHLVPGLSPRATVGLLAHGSLLRTAPKPAWLSSEEHTSELQSLMRISSAVLCLQNNNKLTTN